MVLVIRNPKKKCFVFKKASTVNKSFEKVFFLQTHQKLQNKNLIFNRHQLVEPLKSLI